MQNDMRNRFAELIKEIGNKWEDLRNNFLDEKIDDIPDFQDFLTDNLIANGAILPPCKVNDKVYYISVGEVYTATVEEIYYNGEYFAFNVRGELSKMQFDLQGSDVYFTPEAAQLALKGGSNNG